MTAPALVARAVTHTFGSTRALDGVSLEVAPGECVALVGESGSGKTTLLRAFNGMLRPDAGEVLVRGRSVAEEDPVSLRRSIGYVPQDGGLFPHWTVLRNSSLVPTLLEYPDADVRATRAMESVGLHPATFGERRPGSLSGGQRQRVALARALAAEPSIILLDEPFGALDAITRSDMHRLFLELRRLTSFAALLVTHDLREAFRLADRVAVMRAGRVDQVATPDELCETPRTPYVRELLERAGISTPRA